MSNAIELECCDFSNISFGNFHIVKKSDLFETDPKYYLVSAAFKYEKRPLTITFEGFVASDRILVSEFDKVESYSLPIEFEDDEKLELFSKFSELITSEIEGNLSASEDWNLTEIVKDDKIYLKIKFGKNEKTPILKSNIPINNKKLSDTNIYQGQKVKVTANVNFYFNFATRVGGASLNIKALDFETNEDVDEVSETPKRKAKDQLTPATPRKPKSTLPKGPYAEAE